MQDPAVPPDLWVTGTDYIIIPAQGINYSTYAVISSFVLHSKFGLNQGFDQYDDSLDINKQAGNQNAQISADIVYNKFSNWLNNNKLLIFFKAD